MGRIRSVQIKKLAENLLEKHRDKLEKDFEKNKEVLDKILETESKKIRNRLAGYIAHLVKKEEKFHSLKVSYQPPVDTRKRKGRGRRRK